MLFWPQDLQDLEDQNHLALELQRGGQEAPRLPHLIGKRLEDLPTCAKDCTFRESIFFSKWVWLAGKPVKAAEATVTP